MNLLCLVFGHKSLQGIYSGAEYMRVVPGAIDGIGREHARLYATCPRCEREYSAGAIHLPARDAERELVKKLGAGAADLRFAPQFKQWTSTPEVAAAAAGSLS